MDPVQVLGERLTWLDKYLISVRKEWLDPCDHPTINTQPMECQQEPLMINLIKCLAEVHDYDIRLAALIESIIQILSELDQLCIAAYPALKTTLILEE